MLRRLAVPALVLSLPTLALAQAPRLPDSPTGRAIGGWLDLLQSRLAPEAFAERWLAPGAARDVAALARLVSECGGSRPGGARKTGALSATLSLPGGDGTTACAIAFELEADPPHRVRSWGVEVGEDAGVDDHEDAGGTLPPLELPDAGDAAAAVDAWLRALAADGLFSGSVLVAREGRVAFEGGYGMADRDASEKATPNTRYDVGSITKAFTKVAIGQLARDGRLRLDDTVAQHLPDYPDPEIAKRITIEQLLDHRSGLGDIFNDRYRAADRSVLVAPRDFFPLFAGEPLRFEPGTAQEYSNAGYVVLGAIVEAVSGTDYFSYVREHVFAPAGMADSGFLPKGSGTPRLAVGYTRLMPDGSRGALTANHGRLPVRGCPAGSSSHTARDLLRFDRTLRDGTLLGSWTGWWFGDDAPTQGGGAGSAANAGYGIAGGGPGVNAALESEGDDVVVVLANLDPPIAGRVAAQLRRASPRLGAGDR